MRARELAAELEVLERYDEERRSMGHDYGNEQRHAELVRREHELEAATGGYREAVKLRGELAPAEVLEAFNRVAAPKLRRLERERFRRETPATSRTREAWARLELEVSQAVDD